VNTKQLHYFIAIATEGTFTKASARLRVAQAALTNGFAIHSTSHEKVEK